MDFKDLSKIKEFIETFYLLFNNKNNNFAKVKSEIVDRMTDMLYEENRELFDRLED